MSGMAHRTNIIAPALAIIWWDLTSRNHDITDCSEKTTNILRQKLILKQMDAISLGFGSSSSMEALVMVFNRNSFLPGKGKFWIPNRPRGFLCWSLKELSGLTRLMLYGRINFQQILFHKTNFPKFSIRHTLSF